MTKTIKPNAETTELWVRLNLAHRTLSRRFESQLREAGLPSPDWYDILWGLERAPDGLRQFELQKHCLYDQPNLSRTLKRMMNEGLVSAEPVCSDGRGRTLRLTDAGRTLRARMWKIYGALMIEAIEDRLTKDEARQVIAGLKALDPHARPLFSAR